MKNLGILVLVIMALCLPVWGFAGPAPQQPKIQSESSMLAGRIFLVDDFESGSLKSPREWWVFDVQKAEVVLNKDLTQGDQTVATAVGNYSLQLAGPAKNWYAGGCGTYLAKPNQDLSSYNYFQADIYGNGPGSGTLKVELYDDDNGNWVTEQDPKNNYLPVYDDKWVYDIKVDWSGWKRLSLAISDFVDDNPGVGDDIWNPQQTSGSGGFNQVQFICLGSADKGKVDYYADNILFTVEQK